VGLGACAGPPTADGRPTSDDVLVMYGSSRCGICKGFRRNLVREGIDYEFLDVRADPANSEAMWGYVRKARPNAGRVRFPVMVYGEHILVSPTWPQFQRFYARVASGG